MKRPLFSGKRRLRFDSSLNYHFDFITFIFIRRFTHYSRSEYHYYTHLLHLARITTRKGFTFSLITQFPKYLKEGIRNFKTSIKEVFINFVHVCTTWCCTQPMIDGMENLPWRDPFFKRRTKDEVYSVFA